MRCTRLLGHKWGKWSEGKTKVKRIVQRHLLLDPHIIEIESQSRVCLVCGLKQHSTK